MAFPSYAPSSRSFSAGDYAYKTFQSQSGKEVRILYGDKRTGMTLDLGYSNISDTKADDFIAHYDEVKGGFTAFTLPAAFRTGWGGNTAAIDAATGNQWRYSDPPTITSVRPGISSVTVRLVGVL
jgi:hypothetical protein